MKQHLWPVLRLLMVLTFGAVASIASAEVAPFTEQTPPPAPDYALASSWAAGPFGSGASAAVPAGASPAARHPKVDVFFIHPTTLLSKARWNQDVADAKTNAWTDVSSIARQASIFNGCCRVFAPRYRQAAFLSDKVGSRDKALELAYGDIERAFDYYLQHENHGRPFILAGHSQGGALVAELVEKRIDGTPLQGRMVAAYAIGMNLAEGEFGLRFKHVPICATPAQTGCLIQWNSILPTADIPMSAHWAQQTFIDKYGDVPGKITLCVNPLTFDRAIPAAGADKSKGAAPGDPGDGPVRPLVGGGVAAHCDQGMLVVEPSAALALKPLPGGVMHYHDLGLFYADVRANAITRVKAYLDAHPDGR